MDSAEAVSVSSSSLLMVLSNDRISLTCSFPRVRVPVLSKAMAFTFPIFSRTSPDLIIMPRFVAWPMAAIIAVGVARTRAQGQNTTRIVTERTISWVIIPAIAAVSIARGTSQLAALSASLCIGAFRFSASLTI